MIHNCIFEHVDIESDVKGARSHRRHLAKHNIFCDSVAVVFFADCGRFHENFNGLFERTPHQSAGVCSIDSVTGDSH